MKKVIVILMAALLVLGMAACTNKPAETPVVSNPTEAPAPVNNPTEAPAPTEEPAPAPLADEGHAIWTVHGQQVLVDGTPNGWNGKDAEIYEKAAMVAITLDDVKAISEEVYNALAGKDLKYLYSLDIILGTNDAGWTTNCLIDGKMFKANGSYAIKAAPCTVDVDGDNKVYAEDFWIPDAKVSNAESLTPATLFMPAWQEEADENGFNWTANPVCIGGSGLYTLIVAQYKNASAPDQPGFGFALVLKEAMDGFEYEEILAWVAADHTYGIIGGFNGWAEDVAMTDNGDGTWSGEVELTAGTEFKVRADGAWDFSWGDPTTESGNCVVDADGTYVVTIAFPDGNGVVTVAPKA